MNLTPGTSLWAIQQMLEGKKVRHRSWGPEEYIYIKDDVIVAEDDDVQSLTQHMYNCAGWLLWTPPNPYPKGTFAWAWEEINRGKKLSVHEPVVSGYPKYFWLSGGLTGVLMTKCGGCAPHTAMSIETILINSTDWELVE